MKIVQWQVRDRGKPRKTLTDLAVISGFRRDIDNICAILGYYRASCGNPSPTFRDNLSVSSSSAEKSKTS
jgi:hypothetical protein